MRAFDVTSLDLPMHHSSYLVEVPNTVSHLHDDVSRKFFAEIGQLDAVKGIDDNVSMETRWIRRYQFNAYIWWKSSPPSISSRTKK
jgi:hypothetical protein